MLRKKNSEPAQLPEARQELLEFESPAVQPGKKDPKQFLKHDWKKITAVVCVAAVAAAVLLPKTSKKDVQASTQYVEAALERRDITNTFSGSGTISAANTYTVKSLVKGTVLTADFEVGDTIEKGTVLYTIDSSDVATSVEKAQLALEQAQRSYDDAADAQYIRSVIGGTVASIKVKAGDYVTAGQEIATVRDDSSLLLTLEFPAADASNFAVGQAAQVMLNGTFETLSGTVQAVAGTDTISSGNLLVRTVTIAVPNNGSLTTAQAASASINGVSALASAGRLPAPADRHSHHQRHRVRCLCQRGHCRCGEHGHCAAFRHRAEQAGAVRCRQSAERTAFHERHRKTDGKLYHHLAHQRHRDPEECQGR